MKLKFHVDIYYIVYALLNYIYDIYLKRNFYLKYILRYKYGIYNIFQDWDLKCIYFRLTLFRILFLIGEWKMCRHEFIVKEHRKENYLNFILKWRSRIYYIFISDLISNLEFYGEYVLFLFIIYIFLLIFVFLYLRRNFTMGNLIIS